jgi:hypothetical protein
VPVPYKKWSRFTLPKVTRLHVPYVWFSIWAESAKFCTCLANTVNIRSCIQSVSKFHDILEENATLHNYIISIYYIQYYTNNITYYIHYFYILLSVHHGMILGKWPTWRRTILFYVFIFNFNSLHVSSTPCSSSGEANCVNTTSVNRHSVSVAL